MNEIRDGLAATLLPDGRVLAMGGYDGSTYLSSAEVFVPEPATLGLLLLGGLAALRRRRLV